MVLDMIYKEPTQIVPHGSDLEAHFTSHVLVLLYDLKAFC